MYHKIYSIDFLIIYDIFKLDHPIKVRYSVSGLRGILEGGSFFIYTLSR